MELFVISFITTVTQEEEPAHYITHTHSGGRLRNTHSDPKRGIEREVCVLRRGARGRGSASEQIQIQARRFELQLRPSPASKACTRAASWPAVISFLYLFILTTSSWRSIFKGMARSITHMHIHIKGPVLCIQVQWHTWGGERRQSCHICVLARVCVREHTCALVNTNFCECYAVPM